jgi:cleavage and polyadenylation specificity factor subunit 3
MERGDADFGQVMNAVIVVQTSSTSAELRWASNTSNDMIADATLAVLLGMDASPATVKRALIGTTGFSSRSRVMLKVL